MPKLRYPTLITWTDPSGVTHIPPDPPMIDGYPPWWPRPNEYKRANPLKKCPALACRRTYHCAALLYGKYCQKTHLEREAFRQQIIDRIDAFTRAQGREPVEFTSGQSDTPLPDMKRALQQRQDEYIEAEMLKFQTQWIEKQKKKWAKKQQFPINCDENCLTLTTR